MYICAKTWCRSSYNPMRGMLLPEFRSWDEPTTFNWLVTSTVTSFLSLTHEISELDENTFLVWWKDSTHFQLDMTKHMEESPKKNEFIDRIALTCSVSSLCTTRPLDCTLSCLIRRILSSRKAAFWMRIVAENHPKNRDVIYIDLAKKYLERAMRCSDCDGDSSYGLTNVYMAVLCYITGQYQKATDYCTLATRSQTYLSNSSRVLDGEILPKVDDNIDTVLGLVVFYRYVQTATMKHRQYKQHVSVFTTKLFAHYLNIRHLLVAKCCLAPKTQVQQALQEVKFLLCKELEVYFNRILSAPSLYVTDCMLLKCSISSTFEQLSSIADINLDSCNRRQLVEMMALMPIQQMLKYRQSMLPQDIDPQFVTVIKTKDFTALRLYRCKLYERCAQLCQRAVYEKINRQVRLVERLCFSYREFVQSMDEDIASLIGMTVLVDKIGIQSKLKRKELVNISELTMSVYLLTQCQIKIFSSQSKPDISALANVLDLVSEAEKLISSTEILDHLMLKLAERLSVMYVTRGLNPFF